MTDELYTYIHQPLWIKAQIRSKEAQINDLRLMMLPCAIRYDKDAVQSSPALDPMAAYIERLTELESDIVKLKQLYVTKQKELASYIEQLPPDEADVITARYVTGLKFEEIAEGVHVAESTVYRWHRLGLRHLEEIIFEIKDDSK